MARPFGWAQADSAPPEPCFSLPILLLERVAAIDEEHGKQITERDEQIKFKDAKLQKLTFELARLKRLKFGVRTEAMTADQRRLFEETLAEDEADLQARIDALRGDKTPAPPAVEGRVKRQPRRQPIPEHLRRVEHYHEPEDTTCPAPDCGRPMVRIGEDVSERLDIVPAEFFAHRHIRGKWACKCCQTLAQEPVAPQLIDKGLPAPGLVAHVLVSRFVDHIPYYRQETINARSGVHTPRTTLAAWAGAAGAELEPLGQAHKAFVLGSKVLHADETPVPMLDPGAGKTKKAYIWGYARSEFDGLRGVVYDFCVGRGAKYPVAFLDGWNGTLVCDDYKAYEPVLKLGTRIEAGCLVHYLERGFIWCSGGPSQVLRGGSHARSPHKIRWLRGTARRPGGPLWASTPWYSPARCLPSSKTPASRRASSAG